MPQWQGRLPWVRAGVLVKVPNDFLAGHMGRRADKRPVTRRTAGPTHRQFRQKLAGPHGIGHDPNPQRQKRGRHHQRQHSCDAQTKHDCRGQLLPPQRRGAVDRIAAIAKIEAEAKHHRRKARHCCDGRQQNRANTILGRANDRLDPGHVFLVFLIGVDQDDIVVHHNPGKGHDAGARHDDRKRLTHDQHPDQHTGGRQDDGPQHQ
mmetsp:Transcript_22798/g.37905  ORF Transcript_22798/g.37905 Transcript_22798/m.37905 type:complete len:206 (+) Transcript_22798:3818-4435(+)